MADRPVTEAQVYGQAELEPDSTDIREWTDNEGVTRQVRPPRETVPPHLPTVQLVWRGEKFGKTGRVRRRSRISYGNHHDVVVPPPDMREAMEEGTDLDADEFFDAHYHDVGRHYHLVRGEPLGVAAEDADWLLAHPDLLFERLGQPAPAVDPASDRVEQKADAQAKKAAKK